MKIRKKALGVLPFLMLFTIGISIQAFAAKKLTEVFITVNSNFKVGEHCTENDVEVTTKSTKYSVSDVEIMNEIDDWGRNDTPVLEVTLDAEEGYYFSITKSTITVKGGTYISGRKKSTTSVVLKIQLPSLREQVGEIDQARWISQTVGSWSETYNVGYYEVHLYRDDKSAGDIQRVNGTNFDFARIMLRPGTYSYKVRAVNAQDNTIKSDWREAEGRTSIDEAAAAQFKSQYGSTIPSGALEPGQAADQKNQQLGWILDGNGWWYHNGNGSYTASNWQFIDGKWYFFDSKGYMVTGWIDWNGNSYYCNPENGDMLVSAMVPDGSGRRVDSTGAWIQ